MKNVLAAILTLTVLSARPAQAADEVDEIRSLIADYAVSVNKLDMKLAETIWSQEEGISFITPRGHLKGWEEIRNKFYLGAMKRVHERELKVRNISIRLINEEAAWGDFYWDFQVTTKDGRKTNTSGRETQVWKKERGRWKIIHVHYSKMPTTQKREGS